MLKYSELILILLITIFTYSSYSLVKDINDSIKSAIGTSNGNR